MRVLFTLFIVLLPNDNLEIFGCFFSCQYLNSYIAQFESQSYIEINFCTNYLILTTLNNLFVINTLTTKRKYVMILLYKIHIRKNVCIMEKQLYDFLYSSEREPKGKMNEPFTLMKAKDALMGNRFCIGKLNSKNQNTHAHDYYQIWYILKGNCLHKIDNRKVLLNRGDMILIPPFSYHSMSDGSDDLIVIIVDFTDKLFAGTKEDKNLMLYCITPLYIKQTEEQSVFLADTNIENLILEMFNEFILKRDFHNHVIKSNLTKLIVAIERMNNQKDISLSGNERAVTETLKYIHSRLNEKITIQDLCENVNISDTTLGVHFKNKTGKTIVEYINSLKIDKAKQLLSGTNMRIIDISYELGFNDGAYFNRVFKKFVKLTPNEYRKQKRK